MPGGSAPRCRRATPLLLLAAAVACGARRPPETASAASEALKAPYSATLQVTAEARGRGFSLAAGAVVDPAGAARLELRDPMGATLLLLFLTPEEGRILSPDQRQEARWEAATETLPWAPRDLWALLTGTPPEGARPQRRAVPSARSATWPGELGGLALRSTPAEGRAFPPASAHLKGPGAARLALVWKAVFEGDVSAGALLPPPPAPEEVPLNDLLEEVLR